MPPPVSVELRHVSKRFGAVAAVDDVNLCILEGEFFALIGPSGCGKTTTLRLVGGLEQPDQGDIWLAGKVVTERPPYERRSNIVFQNYALFPHLSVLDNVAFGLRLKAHRLPESIIVRLAREALELVQLNDLGSRRPQQLSGGQQQRVALARALVLRPEVLLLDEPLGALDRQLRKTMQSELRRIQRDVRTTFLYVTHDQEEAFSMADRVAVMRQGKIEQLGTPQEIFETPRTAFVANFMGLANVFMARVTAITAPAVTLQTPNGWRTFSPHNLRVSIGQTISFAVRPDTVQVVPKGDPWQRQVMHDGKVLHKAYLGEMTEVTVALPGGDTVVGRMASRIEQKYHFQTDDLVRVGWDVEDCQLLAE